MDVSTAWVLRDTNWGYIGVRIERNCVRRVGVLRLYGEPYIRVSRGVCAYLVFGGGGGDRGWFQT